MADEDKSDKKKPHRARQAGAKADKKKLKGQSARKDETLTAAKRNPKAFAINSVHRAEARFRRKEDITAKKQHIPVVDSTPEEPPPILVAVVGPPKVGKTTLITNLVKSFTKTNVTDIQGPITVVTSKKRRITLIECNNDINCMIDIAKCADLVLLLSDASFGFEMEIFEFLNICQVHGMPKIMGVLTHLDMIKNAKTLKRRKRELKHRFWTEVYDGAKLFYLSGIIHGEYMRNEIKNLGRFIAVMKTSPMNWRGAHSYILADRIEDVTNTEEVRLNPKCDREVILYGYIRGVPLNKENMVHIAGLGDMRISDLSVLADPCPLPSKEKKRSLLEKERLLYAPMSGVGGIVYDKDAVYIELAGSHGNGNKNEEQEEQEQILQSLVHKKDTLDEKLDKQEFRLFSDSKIIKSKDFKVNEGGHEEDSDEDNVCLCVSSDESIIEDSGVEDSEDGIENEEYNKLGWHGSEDENITDDNDNGSSDDEYDDGDVQNNMKWKENLLQNAKASYYERQTNTRNLLKTVYGVFEDNSNTIKKFESDNEDVSDDELGGLFRVAAKKQDNIHKEKFIKSIEENFFFEKFTEINRDWLNDESKATIKNSFVTGNWRASENAEELLNMDDLSDDSDTCYGEFEDCETGEKFTGNPKVEEESEDDIKTVNPNDTCGTKRKLTRIEEENMTKAELRAKKMKLKEKFDAEYDNPNDEHRIKGDHQYYEALKAEAHKQSELNKSEFVNVDENFRIQIEGFRAGLYVRIGFKHVPCELVDQFDPTIPILIGGLNMGEENVGYVNCTVKKHRWYKKILKSGDPIIISMGWRRFQTQTIFSKLEDNLKHRYLKYTPNHVTCSLTFYGPITPQRTGFLAIQSVKQDQTAMRQLGFRIAATGSVAELDKSTQIMKKLKLIGKPAEVHRKTAFINGMFTSALEVAKFEGAKIKTVSGIRGQIKKARSSPPGSFRATFEDRILMSDIIFCRTWFRVDVPKFYAPVTSLLLPLGAKSEWQGMKTLGQLKREKNVQNEVNADHLYTEIQRVPKVFKPLSIPKSLQAALPYKDKPKLAPLHKKQSFESQRVVVVPSPHDQKVNKMMDMVKSNYVAKMQKEKIDKMMRIQAMKNTKKAEELRKLKRQKVLKKKVFQMIGKMEKAKDKKGKYDK